MAYRSRRSTNNDTVTKSGGGITAVGVDAPPITSPSALFQPPGGGESCIMPPSPSTSPSTATAFPRFGLLSDDLALLVLSFVAEAPFESSTDMAPIGTLTHLLPLVCRRFRAFVRTSDILWSEVLVRRMVHEPDVWEVGLMALANENCRGGADGSADGDVGENGNREAAEGRRDGYRGSGTTTTGGTTPHPHSRVENASANNGGNSSATTPSGDEQQYTYEERLVRRACDAMGRKRRGNDDELHPTFAGVGTAQLVFRHVVSRHLRFSGPVFYMPGQVSLGREFGLHFFEPRYRLLIAEVMAGQPSSNLVGAPLVLDSRRDFPQFVYANHADPGPGRPACIVQVRQCRIYSNGTADVILVPSAHVWIERIGVRPASGGLCDAGVMRMGRDASRSMEALVARDAGVHWYHHHHHHHPHEGGGGAGGVGGGDAAQPPIEVVEEDVRSLPGSDGQRRNVGSVSLGAILSYLGANHQRTDGDGDDDEDDDEDYENA